MREKRERERERRKFDQYETNRYTDINNTYAIIPEREMRESGWTHTHPKFGGRARRREKYEGDFRERERGRERREAKPQSEEKKGVLWGL